MNQLFPINISLGASNKGIIQLGSIGGNASTSSKSGLNIPWDDDQDSINVFNMLRWSRCISDFKGRDTELMSLKKWVNSNKHISIQFLIGDGGTGKTRLAAQFAQKMREKGWSSGFVSLKNECNVSLDESKGVLIVIDYPEEHPDLVETLMNYLADFDTDGKLRVLFVTRHSKEKWINMLRDSHVSNRTEDDPITLENIEPDYLFVIYCSVLKKVCKLINTKYVKPDKGKFVDWFSKTEDVHITRVLFIVGAAINNAKSGNVNKLDYKSIEIVDALVERELTRLRVYAGSQKIKNKDIFSILLAMATISGFAPIDTIRKWVKNEDLNLKLKPDQDIEHILDDSKLLKEEEFTVGEESRRLRFLPALEPDIVGSYFVVKVLQEKGELAPERVWSAFSEINLSIALYRYERIDHDIKILLHEAVDEEKYIMDKLVLSNWLRESVKGNCDRCSKVEEVFNDFNLSQCCLPAAFEVYETLSANCEDDVRQAFYAGTLANIYGNMGINDIALQKILAVSDIYRRLYGKSPDEHVENFIASLINKSRYLSAFGDNPGALEAIKEAVDVLRRLSIENPARFESDLSMSLNNLSYILSNLGEYDCALKNSKEAVKLCRRLSEGNPVLFEADLSSCLTNLSRALSLTDDDQSALETIKEAVEIRRHLSKNNPARFEQDLALDLNSMSVSLANLGDNVCALEAIKEAVQIYRRLSVDNPARFEPDLADSLHNMSTMLPNVGDNPGALEVIREAVDIYHRLSEENPARFEPDLAKSYVAWGWILLTMDEFEEAVGVLFNGIQIIQPYAKKYPGSPSEGVLNLLISEHKRAAEAAGIEIPTEDEK
jgi:tetratricopeptide (TPR) repeat protein